MGKIDETTLKALKEKARSVRLGIIEALGIDHRGHLGGSMSCADIVAALYFYKMKHSSKSPDDPNRDRFIMSKGHSVLAQYAALAESGYFSKDILATTKSFGSVLQGHPERETPGIEANTGSLGQGFSMGVGMAIAGKLDKRDYHVYVIVGDGELAEGQIWEATMTSNVYSLDNLTVIVDANGIQAMGKTRDRYSIQNIPGRFAAFGWKTFEIDGHDLTDIAETLDKATDVKGAPTAIIAYTVKGKGVTFAENSHAYHNNLLTPETREKAIASVMAL
ncbi:transketolase [Synergistales bacterium]|nr:transketolase [Synergistales bacterium]